jgi:hypothetical protein
MADTRPQDEIFEGPPLAEAEPERLHWAARAFLGFFAMGVGAVYGAMGYKIFAEWLSPVGSSGLMTMSFLMLLPLAIGVLSVMLVQRRHSVGFVEAIAMSTIPGLLFCFLAGTLLREGFICILMALPLVLVFAAIGGTIALLSKMFGDDNSPKLLSVALVVPFMFGAAEQETEVVDSPQLLTRSLHIDAAPQVVWHHVNFPVDIDPHELEHGLAYRIGVPYPIEGRTVSPGVGGLRHLVWQRGVAFDEDITAWEENRRVGWTYRFSPQSFPQGSLDDHIVIGGKYFNLVDSTYTLTPEGEGTRLDIDVHFRVSTHFNWYAVPWARLLIGDTAETILGFYKRRSENPAPSTGA